MKVFLKLVAVLCCGLVAVVACSLIALAIGDVPGWLALLFLVSPFTGTFGGGWLVSRHSTSGQKVGWIVGGGIGFGALIWLGFIAMVIALAVNMCNGYEVC